MIDVVEVAPRDGLQAEAAVLPTETKLSLIRRLIGAGVKRIEVASFVHPMRVPQMADAEAVVAGLQPADGISAIGLVLNRRGLTRALETRIDEVNFVVYAADGYSRSNANAPMDEVIAEVEAMLPRAGAAGRRTSVTISVAFGDPYDGEVPVGRVAEIAGRVAAAGAHEVALGDTIGAAVPADVTRMLPLVRASAPGAALRCHFHDTRGTAIANAVAALDAGGNLATEDLAYVLDRTGLEHGLSLPDLVDTAAWLESKVGTPVKSRLGRAGKFP